MIMLSCKNADFSAENYPFLAGTGSSGRSLPGSASDSGQPAAQPALRLLHNYCSVVTGQGTAASAVTAVTAGLDMEGLSSTS